MWLVGAWLMTLFLGLVGWYVLYAQIQDIKNLSMYRLRQLIVEEVKAYARQHEKVSMADIIKVIAP